MSDSSSKILAISVGNSRTSFGLYEGDEDSGVRALSNDDPGAIAREILEAAKELAGADESRALLATVNPEFSESLVATIRPGLDLDLLLVGDDVPVPIEQAVHEKSGVGLDRLLAALAGFDRVTQACAVIDAGTAVTVDFVDGEGVFQGGAILPGPRLMLDALSARAALLPDIELREPVGVEPFGKNTEECMLNGVFHGLRGAVRHIIEGYAERYGAYPRILATGGDAHVLFDTDEFVETIVDDLILKGIALSWRKAVGEETEAPLRLSDAEGAG